MSNKTVDVVSKYILPLIDPFDMPFLLSCLPSGPITPSVPTNYVAHMEAVDTIYNMTHYLEEYYHYDRQVLATIDVTSTGHTHTIFYYSINTAVVMETFVGEWCSST